MSLENGPMVLKQNTKQQQKKHWLYARSQMWPWIVIFAIFQGEIFYQPYFTSQNANWTYWLNAKPQI